VIPNHRYRHRKKKYFVVALSNRIEGSIVNPNQQPSAARMRESNLAGLAATRDFRILLQGLASS
jgi:hypothetical protein